MDLSNLKPAEGSIKNEKKRLGRGQGSGKGGTSTRGNKGAKSRSGYSRKRGFEGGQMPIQRTSPKFGFKNFNRVEYKAVNIKVLQRLAEEQNLTSIDPDILYEYGMIPKNCLVKILGVGTLTKKVEVKAHAFSATAQKAIESLEGTVIKL
ncbi:MAG: 50S ribosomal protein L15 [Bacteroidetes bacterium CG02_land_8_20_14_3_00_31_25]|nr:50S ribosomal protein L15 [Bacteroidota bacterium]PIV57903.1 MAG: 50S ribosomal protein L15 [Bacteroidetes bacterium CG02_land_8_20_14_3_00_31_25]PIX32743.1 MAG: 50S ribosomal protein L15 [Bacteroidetes bacterium CG_4_8_14_3_um_filter_31_14]PIY02591.1 MAG: 50S ribosomal protein L15 [Bacteroidetes bacterium CG_4_10_14_3_um_filter_31_20]